MIIERHFGEEGGYLPFRALLATLNAPAPWAPATGETDGVVQDAKQSPVLTIDQHRERDDPECVALMLAVSRAVNVCAGYIDPAAAAK